MGRVKIYGAANDAIPPEEMAAAKLIQTAGAWGLRSCRGALYRKGRKVYGEGECKPSELEACCALGASMLDPEHPLRGLDGSAVDGNDNHNSLSNGPAHDVGRMFYLGRRVW